MPRIKQRDKSLADQLSRAASSIALNIGEAELSDPGNRKSRLFAGHADLTTTQRYADLDATDPDFVLSRDARLRNR